MQHARPRLLHPFFVFVLLQLYCVFVVGFQGVKLDKLFGQQMKLSLSLGGRGSITQCFFLCFCVCVFGV